MDMEVQTAMLEAGYRTFKVRDKVFATEKLTGLFLAVFNPGKILIRLARTTRLLTFDEKVELGHACNAFGPAVRELTNKVVLSPKAHTIACGYFCWVAHHYGTIGKAAADGIEAFHTMTTQYRKLTASVLKPTDRMRCRLQYSQREQSTAALDRPIRRRKRREPR